MSLDRRKLFGFLGFVIPVGTVVWYLLDGFLGKKLSDFALIFWTVVVTLFLWYKAPGEWKWND